MVVSISGYSVLQPTSSLLKSGKVPGTNITLRMRADVLPLFLALARDYHDTVAPLRYGECGAYNYRPAMGGGGWSDHAAGVAVDLNWGHEGAAGLYGGMSTMSKAQVTACAALKEKYRVVIWGGDAARGGDYSQPKNWDPMHYALKPGTSMLSVRQVITALGIQPDGTTPRSKWTRVVAPWTWVYDRPYTSSARLRRLSFGTSVEYIDVVTVDGAKWLRNRAGNYVLAARTAARV